MVVVVYVQTVLVLPALHAHRASVLFARKSVRMVFVMIPVTVIVDWLASQIVILLIYVMHQASAFYA
jgi:hypothetical protein